MSEEDGEPLSAAQINEPREKSKYEKRAREVLDSVQRMSSGSVAGRNDAGLFQLGPRISSAKGGPGYLPRFYKPRKKRKPPPGGYTAEQTRKYEARKKFFDEARRLRDVHTIFLCNGGNNTSFGGRPGRNQYSGPMKVSLAKVSIPDLPDNE